MNPSISSKAKLKQGLQLFNMGKQRGWDFLFLVKFWCILSILTQNSPKLSCGDCQALALTHFKWSALYTRVRSLRKSLRSAILAHLYFFEFNSLETEDTPQKFKS